MTNVSQPILLEGEKERQTDRDRQTDRQTGTDTQRQSKVTIKQRTHRYL